MMRFISKSKTVFKAMILIAPLLIIGAKQAHALSYKYCNDPNQSASCFVALEKLRTLINPLTGKNYFNNFVHYNDQGILFSYPDLHIAETDLNNDGFNEIIVKIPELADQLEGYFCKPNYQCPHFILQDRNVSGKATLENVKIMGPIYTVAIGLSTDEVVDGYRSLRAYTDEAVKNFNVYQYDDKEDNYFNVSAPK